MIRIFPTYKSDIWQCMQITYMSFKFMFEFHILYKTCHVQNIFKIYCKNVNLHYFFQPLQVQIRTYMFKYISYMTDTFIPKGHVK